MKKISLCIGFILTLFGMIFTIIVSIYNLTIEEPISASELAEDYNPKTMRFRSYYNRDIITVSGMITKEKKNYESKYDDYELDKKLNILSVKDIGNVGDQVIVKLEVKEVYPHSEFKVRHNFQEVKVVSFQKVGTLFKSDIMVYKTIGIIVFIIGNIVFWISHIEVKKNLPINKIKV